LTTAELVVQLIDEQHTRQAAQDGHEISKDSVRDSNIKRVNDIANMRCYALVIEKVFITALNHDDQTQALRPQQDVLIVDVMLHTA
jgi:hypothetical protein